MEIVQIITLCVIAAQFCVFAWNLYRMVVFRNIFSHPDTYMLTRNAETNFVNGISGVGNNVFRRINDSINKYLGNNAGSVIDFGLLKDAVDRNCDAVEDDIAVQTPIPLYLGLAGTMAGIILGLTPMLENGSLTKLLSGSMDASAQVAQDIPALLSGVKWAMYASITGIILTTINSFVFKTFKLREENGKNTFLAWMQSKLLPELPSDTSEALNNLVKNLNKFNRTFANNTANLGEALRQVNESYEIQGEIIKAVYDMDFMKMANANISVLQELKECTDKLEEFNQYLNDIKGYTDAIHNFEEQFQSQADRVHVLEEISDFFNRHKGSMSKVIADEDDTLKQALEQIKSSSETNITELKNRLVEQSSAFKQMMTEEKRVFEEFATTMRSRFEEQIGQMPKMLSTLERVTEIPTRLDKLIEKVDQSNKRLEDSVRRTLAELSKQRPMLDGNTSKALLHSDDNSTQTADTQQRPMLLAPWMQWVMVGSVALIAVVLIWDFVEQRVDFTPIVNLFSR